MLFSRAELSISTSICIAMIKNLHGAETLAFGSNTIELGKTTIQVGSIFHVDSEYENSMQSKYHKRRTYKSSPYKYQP